MEILIKSIINGVMFGVVAGFTFHAMQIVFSDENPIKNGKLVIKKMITTSLCVGVVVGIVTYPILH